MVLRRSGASADGPSGSFHGSKVIFLTGYRSWDMAFYAATFSEQRLETIRVLGRTKQCQAAHEVPAAMLVGNASGAGPAGELVQLPQ